MVILNSWPKLRSYSRGPMPLNCSASSNAQAAGAFGRRGAQSLEGRPCPPTFAWPLPMAPPRSDNTLGETWEKIFSQKMSRHHAIPTRSNGLTCENIRRRRWGAGPDPIRDEVVVVSIVVSINARSGVVRWFPAKSGRPSDQPCEPFRGQPWTPPDQDRTTRNA